MDLLARQLRVGSVKLAQPMLSATREAQVRLNPAQWVTALSSEAAAGKPPGAARPTGPAGSDAATAR